MPTIEEVKAAASAALGKDAEDTETATETESKPEAKTLTWEEINKTINSANTSYRKQIQKDIESANKKQLEAITSIIGGKDKKEPDAEALTQKQQIQELVEFKKETLARERQQKLDNLQTSLLATNGIKEKAKHALAYLKANDMIKFENGEYQIELDGMPYDFEEGFKLFAQSEDGRVYRDKVGVVGGGSGEGSKQSPANQDVSKPKTLESLRQDVRAQLKAGLPKPLKF